MAGHRNYVLLSTRRHRFTSVLMNYTSSFTVNSTVWCNVLYDLPLSVADCH